MDEKELNSESREIIKQKVFKSSFVLDPFETKQLKFLLDNIIFVYGDLPISKIKELL